MQAGEASATSIAVEPLQTGVWARAGARLEALFDAERDQLPLWLPVGLGLGIAAWFALPRESAWIGFLLAAAGAVAGSLAVGRGTRWGRSIAIFCLAAACGCGLIWTKAERVAAPRLAFPKVAEFTASVESFQRLPAKESVRLVVKPIDAPALPTLLRINVDEDKALAVAPGAKIRLKAWLMPPPSMAVPGSYDFARVAWFQGLGGTGRALGEIQVVEAAESQSWRARLASWRQQLADHIGARLQAGAAGIATALATGDQGAIPEEDAEAMRRSGLAHLLSVSGLHLTAAVGAVMLLTLKLLALSPTLALRWRLTLIAAAAGALAGIAYTLLTGAEVPTVRACVASLLILLGVALGREAFTMRLLAVGALIILLLWPESMAGASFQLSFAAIGAIVALHEHPRVKALLARRDEGFGAKAGRLVLGLILTGLAVEIALAPIALYHFHKAGFYGALANIVAIPLTTFVVMPLEALALLLDLVGLGAPFWWLTEQSLSLLLRLAHVTAAAPGAVALLPSMPRGAFALMVLGGIWTCLWRTRWRVGGLVAVAIGAAWAISIPTPDLIISGDGRHLAVRTRDGGFALLRGRAGDYIRDTLSEASGYEGELLAIEDLPAAACSADLCATDIVREGRKWRLLATRSIRYVDFGPLAKACAEADIVVSERRLPRTCVPRWLKADRDFLSRSGGLSIVLGREPSVISVAGRVGDHPWVQHPGTRK
ncbi:MAG: ComEC/Rec2 family competence protein [Sphingosinicella sp.]|nr:ComEC/Rec2 family competence protein [Sphingosinicella sp.]